MSVYDFQQLTVQRFQNKIGVNESQISGSVWEGLRNATVTASLSKMGTLNTDKRHSSFYIYIRKRNIFGKCTYGS